MSVPASTYTMPPDRFRHGLASMHQGGLADTARLRDQQGNGT